VDSAKLTYRHNDYERFVFGILPNKFVISKIPKVPLRKMVSFESIHSVKVIIGMRMKIAKERHFWCPPIHELLLQLNSFLVWPHPVLMLL